MRRRALLALGAGASVPAVAGCLSGETAGDGSTGTDGGESNESDDDGGEPERQTRPDECPVSRELDVQLPDKMTEVAVTAFVQRYESAYIEKYVIREVGELDSSPSSSVLEAAKPEAGFVVKVTTVWSYTHNEGMSLIAEPAASVPESIDPVDVEELSETADPAVEVAREAAADGTEVRREERGGVDAHEPVADALSPARANESTYYVLVDDQPVTMKVLPASPVVTDAEGTARYYVDGTVVRRTDEDDLEARNGRLVECFPRDEE